MKGETKKLELQYRRLGLDIGMKFFHFKSS